MLNDTFSHYQLQPSAGKQSYLDSLEQFRELTTLGKGNDELCFQVQIEYAKPPNERPLSQNKQHNFVFRKTEPEVFMDENVSIKLSDEKPEDTLRTT